MTGQTLLTLTEGNASNIGTALYVAGLISGLNITGTTVTDIFAAGGINMYYDPLQNPTLNGLTYSLDSGGGLLKPPPPPFPSRPAPCC